MTDFSTRNDIVRMTQQSGQLNLTSISGGALPPIANYLATIIETSNGKKHVLLRGTLRYTTATPLAINTTRANIILPSVAIPDVPIGVTPVAGDIGIIFDHGLFGNNDDLAGRPDINMGWIVSQPGTPSRDQVFLEMRNDNAGAKACVAIFTMHYDAENPNAL